MRLTAYTDFSLRVLMYLAVVRDRRPTIAEVAERYGISRNHLMKVVYELGRAGYVETTRGKHGGLRLARAPETVRLGALVRHTEPELAPVPCLAADAAPGVGGCVIAPACRLRGVLDEASNAFLRVLDRYTLADLVENRASLAVLLGAGAPAVAAGG